MVRKFFFSPPEGRNSKYDPGSRKKKEESEEGKRRRFRICKEIGMKQQGKALLTRDASRLGGIITAEMLRSKKSLVRRSECRPFRLAFAYYFVLYYSLKLAWRRIDELPNRHAGLHTLSIWQRSQMNSLRLSIVNERGYSRFSGSNSGMKILRCLNNCMRALALHQQRLHTADSKGAKKSPTWSEKKIRFEKRGPIICHSPYSSRCPSKAKFSCDATINSIPNSRGNQSKAVIAMLRSSLRCSFRFRRAKKKTLSTAYSHTLPLRCAHSTRKG